MKPTTFGVPLLAMAFSGCLTSNADRELLEARLRDQQDLVARYEKSLASNEQELSIARKESQQLREQLASAGQPMLLPEHADVLLRAEKLAFHTMMTGARNLDGVPGDERLNVVLIPQSGAGETVRLIGQVEIEALDLTRPAGQQSLGRWTFTPEQTRQRWHNGFLASGLQFDLPWEGVPNSDEVVLNARLVAPDGRRLAATHKITVEPTTVATGSRSMSPAAAPRLLPPGADLSKAAAQPFPETTPAASPIQQVAAIEVVDVPNANDQTSRPFPVTVSAAMPIATEPPEEIATSNVMTAPFAMDDTPETKALPSIAEVVAAARERKGRPVKESSDSMSSPAAMPVTATEPSPSLTPEEAKPATTPVQQAKAQSMTSEDFLAAIDFSNLPPLPPLRGRTVTRLPPTTSGEIAAELAAATHGLTPPATVAAPARSASSVVPDPVDAAAVPDAFPATVSSSVAEPAAEPLPVSAADSVHEAPVMEKPAASFATFKPEPLTPPAFPDAAPSKTVATPSPMPAQTTSAQTMPAQTMGSQAMPTQTTGSLRQHLPTPGTFPPIDASLLMKPEPAVSSPRSTTGALPAQTSDRWRTDEIPVLR